MFKFDTGSLAQGLATTAAARIIREVSQSSGPKLVKDVQNVLSIGGLAGRALGMNTGISQLDAALGLAAARDLPHALLGGLSLRQAQAIHQQTRSMRVARKNLFFVRVSDRNPPVGNYQARSQSLYESRIGEVSAAVKNPGAAVAGGLASFFGGGGQAIAEVAISTFDLLAVDVSYGTAIMGDTVQVGSSFIDKPTGRAPIEVQITTMDDEAGTLKKWFQAKQRQVAPLDGSTGLPADYLLDLEIVHAVPSDRVEGFSLAYASKLAVRAHSAQFELSRRDQALAEVQLQFVEFDPFMKA